MDAWRDAEPGKILHEFRTGEMTRTGELPFSPYYGSIDSTPLWLILLGETHDWTGDDALVERLWPNVLAALAWIDDWGDRDGDGFVEYERRAATGLLNQGWKDSGDAIRWSDGTPAATPDRAGRGPGLRLRREAAGRPAGARTRRVRPGRPPRAPGGRSSSAASPRPSRLPDGQIAMALDGDEARGRHGGLQRRPLPVERHRGARRRGHGGRGRPRDPRRCRRAGASARSRRTSPGYNPIGYHTGTVWPHDTAIAAAGARRYGFDAIGGRLSGDLLAAAHHFPAYRLPELFCGFDRASTGAPVAYPVACSPQAWAAGAPLMLIRTMLGLHADASLGQLTLEKPDLPKDITKVVVKGLRVGDASCDLLLHRWRGLTSAEVLRKDGPLEVIVRL